MASRRKTFLPLKGRAPSTQHVNADFMAGLLEGTIKATTIQLAPGGSDGVQRVNTYDDPDPDRPGAPGDNGRLAAVPK